MVTKCNGTNEKVKWKPLSTEDRDKIVRVVSLADELHCCDDGTDGDGPLGDECVDGGAKRMTRKDIVTNKPILLVKSPPSWIVFVSQPFRGYSNGGRVLPQVGLPSPTTSLQGSGCLLLVPVARSTHPNTGHVPIEPNTRTNTSDRLSGSAGPPVSSLDDLPVHTLAALQHAADYELVRGPGDSGTSQRPFVLEGRKVAEK